MSCCGFSLHILTVSAGVFTILESIFGISWSSHGLMLIHTNPNETENSTSKVDEGIIIATVALYGLWLISAITLLYGNSVKSKALIIFWMVITVLIIPFKSVWTGYYGFRLQSVSKSSDLTEQEILKENLITFYFLICFAIGTINFPLNAYFFVAVTQRISEIKKEIKATLGDFTTDQPQIPLSTYQNHTVPEERGQLPSFDQPDNVIPLDNNYRRYSRPDFDEGQIRPQNDQYGQRQIQSDLTPYYNPEQDYHSRAHYDRGNLEPKYNPRPSSGRLEPEYDCHSRPGKHSPEPGYSSRPHYERQSQDYGYSYRSRDVRTNSQINYNSSGEINQGYDVDYENEWRSASGGIPRVKY
ncbi:uncharacterized protein LOC111085904 [Limulus polyphemus]|uniref:Uncharacterized protein LOC111085904 n=1 Tax=Limulus polyphemus TaxID=6850 RepID=A0ABM1SFL0_LIMPO|nr:uncharacterized protein LOC111085904 [Limulus polyphemus]